MKASDIFKIWRRPQKGEKLSGLAADFKELADMRRYVPYLKEFRFNQTSLQSGDARSAFKGRGMEFAEVRSYSYGDDVRDIDWRVTARKNQPYTKLYAEEKDREVYVWLDLSPYMQFGTRKELKSVTASKITALLGWFSLENKDRFGVAVFDGVNTHIFEARRTTDNLLAILKQIETISAQIIAGEGEGSKQPLLSAVTKSLQQFQTRIGTKSIIFIVSSFEGFAANFSREISRLSRNHEVFAVNVYDVLEEIAPPPGEYLAQYNDDKQLLVNSGTDFAKDYQDFFAQKRQKIQEFCAKFNCRYREVRTDLPIYKQLRPI